MKLFAILIVLLVFCAGCAKDVKPQASFEKLSSFEIGSVFEHEIENCDVDPSFENTCTEWIKLLENDKADYLIAGGDIIERGSSKISNDTLYIFTNVEKAPLRFIAIDVNILEEISSGNEWLRR